jgi:hypothetical protein
VGAAAVANSSGGKTHGYGCLRQSQSYIPIILSTSTEYRVVHISFFNLIFPFLFFFPITQTSLRGLPGFFHHPQALADVLVSHQDVLRLESPGSTFRSYTPAGFTVTAIIHSLKHLLSGAIRIPAYSLLPAVVGCWVLPSFSSLRLGRSLSLIGCY